MKCVIETLYIVQVDSLASCREQLACKLFQSLLQPTCYLRA